MRPCGGGWEPWDGCVDPGPYQPVGLERIWGLPLLVVVLAAVWTAGLLLVAWWQDRRLSGPVRRGGKVLPEGPEASSPQAAPASKRWKSTNPYGPDDCAHAVIEGEAGPFALCTMCGNWLVRDFG